MILSLTKKATIVPISLSLALTKFSELLEVLKGQNARFTKQDAVNSLLKSAQKQTTWPGALRHLMVMHKLIHDLGDECYTWISSEKMQHLNQFKTHEPSLGKLYSIFLE